MEINKISSSTPDVYKVENYLSYYRIKDEHIVIIDETLAKVFSNSDYEAINNHIFETWDTVCCYNVEDKGEYWEFVEVDEENCKYDYEPDYEDEDDYAEELKLAKLDEIDRIEELITKVIETKQPQFFDDTELCELEYNEVESAIVYKFENKPVKYFPIKEDYNSLLIKGERNDILYSIALQIYNYYYGVEEDIEEEKVDRYEEVRRIEELIAEAIDTKQPQPFDKSDAYEIDIEYIEEENHNLFEAAVVLKYCNNTERYFPLKDIYNNISTVLKGEEDDILFHIAQQIYTYYYGEEDNIEEE